MKSGKFKKLLAVVLLTTVVLPVAALGLRGVLRQIRFAAGRRP